MLKYLQFVDDFIIRSNLHQLNQLVHMTPTATDIFSRDFADALKTLIRK